MSAAYAIALFGVLSSLAGILAFAWAASRGQLRASESAKFFALGADEPEDASPPSAAPLARRARWIGAALVFVFLCILSSTVLTVLIAARASTPQATAPSVNSSQPAKCPF